MKRLIVTGDDFGLSLEVNRGIERAHRDGVLNTASLMVGAPYAADAIHRARRLQRLKVGLHIVVVRGAPVLNPIDLPAITNHYGLLLNNLFEAGLRFYLSARASSQLRAEIRAQFEGFERSGLTLDHVNAHHHMHIHPTVLDAIVEIGREHNLKAVRLPLEAPRVGLAARARGLLENVCLNPWLRVMATRLAQSRIRTNDYLIGRIDYPNMSRKTVLTLLSDLPDGTTEMCFHPSTKDSDGRSACQANKDLETLTSAEILQTLTRLGIEQTSFAELS